MKHKYEYTKYSYKQLKPQAKQTAIHHYQQGWLVTHQGEYLDDDTVNFILLDNDALYTEEGFYVGEKNED